MKFATNRYMLLRISLLILICLVSAPKLWAQEIEEVRAFYPELLENPVVKELIQSAKKPDHLFHWSRGEMPYGFGTSRNEDPWYKLTSRNATTPVRGNKLALLKFYNVTYGDFAQAQSGLFFWSHPVTGMGLREEEQYARIDQETGKVSQLVVAKPKADATFSIYVSGAKGYIKPESILAAKTDFVLHIRVQHTGQVLWQEWVIQNSDAIEWATQNKSKVSEIVKRYLVNFKPERMPLHHFHGIQSQFIPSNYTEILHRSLSSFFHKRNFGSIPEGVRSCRTSFSQ